ncbi:MAG: sigma-54-dependent Fis family transcriptional regulator [Opitutaceae bacterium]|nr:sigma-54-dependent Fis family transcriptional regulator [Opitutaceae bacterium]
MRILIVDDQRSIRLTTAQAVRAEGHEADTADSGRVALLKLQEERFDLVLLDLRLEGEADGLDYLARLQKLSPQLPVVICTAHASIETAVEAMRRGAHDYLEKPFTPEQLRQLLARIEKARRLRQRVDELEERVAQTLPALDFASADPEMAGVISVLERAAAAKATILILGENGTGKSALARHVHQHSPLAAGPFVTVSCPSLSRELLESELFGHAKGAFTGAVRDTWGKVEAARGGTLFLDEIGELPAELQPKLLRLLQERTYERVGDPKTRTADVRLIAATNRDLAAAVKAGSFREDLFYRLNVISVTVPPLRARPRDLERHAREFLRFFSEESGSALQDFAPEAWTAIRRHPWPGNLRELRNSIERAAILAHGEVVELDDLPAELAAPGGGPEVALGALVPLEAIEQAHVRLVTARTPTLEEAARVLGIDAATIYRKRKRWAGSQGQAGDPAA